MSDPQRKPTLHLLPAILTGTAALLASLTAIYVNLHDKVAQEPATTMQAAPPVPPATPKTTVAAQPVAMRLRLDRIAVQHDGSVVGTTNWRFAVEVDDQPLFVFSQDDLDDAGGRNVVSPKDVGATLDLTPGASHRIVVKAWRNRRLRISEGPPDAQGAGTLSGAGAGALAPIATHADDPGKGAMTLYFSAIAG